MQVFPALGRVLRLAFSSLFRSAPMRIAPFFASAQNGGQVECARVPVFRHTGLFDAPGVACFMRAVSDVLKEVARMWGRHRVSRVAAALAYYAVFALAPVTFMIVVLTRSVLGPKHALPLIESEARPLLGAGGAHGLDVLVRASQHQVSTTPLLIGGAIVVIASFAIFMQVQEALDDVWEIAEQKRGGARELFLLRLHVLIAVGVLALVAVVALLLAVAAGRAAVFGIDLAALAVFLTVTYRVLPNEKAGWRSCAIGALATSGILLGGELLLALYFRRFHPETAYGQAGSVIVLLIWIYYSAQLFLFGAVLTRAIETRRK